MPSNYLKPRVSDTIFKILCHIIKKLPHLFLEVEFYTAAY